MVPPLLETLEFRSSNAVHQPVIRALELLKRYADTKLQLYPVDEHVPLDFVRELWREAVVDDDAEGRPRVNRITHEICVLEALREQLRCKEIWVVAPTAIAIRTTISRPISQVRSVRRITRRSTCRSTARPSSVRCGTSCARPWSSSITASRATRT
jgi:hypothetical protein